MRLDLALGGHQQPFGHTKAVLLVHHHQRQVAILHGGLEDGVGADRDVDRAVGQPHQRAFARPALVAAGEGGDGDGQAAQELLEAGEVLAGQDLGGSEESPLPARLHSGEQGHGGDQRLAGADITLEQAEHGLALAQVVTNLPVRSVLRAGEGEGEPERARQPPIARERPAPPRPDRVADEGQRELVGEHLVIAQPLAGKPRLGFAVDRPQRLAEGGPLSLGEQPRLDPLRHVRQPLQRRLHQGRDAFARDAFGQRIDRLHVRQCLVGRHHVVGVRHLEFVAIAFHASRHTLRLAER